MSGRGQLLLSLADDELILGWRDSEWTGIAPTLEEDVAFSSIAQNEIGHARALYELAAVELDTDADALAFDRAPDEYQCAPLVELRLVDDWALTIVAIGMPPISSPPSRSTLSPAVGSIATRASACSRPSTA